MFSSVSSEHVEEINSRYVPGFQKLEKIIPNLNGYKIALSTGSIFLSVE